MSNTSGSNLFKNPTKWPLIPPWWLLSSPAAAALLNVTSATLHNWRVRGEGPTVVPPMYIRPTQGDPVYYQYAAVRSWAAKRLGIEYTMEDQCRDFFEKTVPLLNTGVGSCQARAQCFDRFFSDDHRQVRQGFKPAHITLKLVQQMDLYYSRQPRQLQPVWDACS